MYNSFFNSNIISKNGTIPLATDVAAPESLCKILLYALSSAIIEDQLNIVRVYYYNNIMGQCGRHSFAFFSSRSPKRRASMAESLKIYASAWNSRAFKMPILYTQTLTFTAAVTYFIYPRPVGVIRESSRPDKLDCLVLVHPPAHQHITTLDGFCFMYT